MTTNIPEEDPLIPAAPVRQSSFSQVLDETQGNLILRLDAWRSSRHMPSLGLPALYCLIALVFLTLFAIEAFQHHQTTHARVLLLFAILTVGCFIYLRITNNPHFTVTLIVIVLGALCVYLFYSGGISGTGPLWYFVFPLVALFLQRLWEGLVSILTLFAVTLLILSSSLPGFDPTLYSQAFIERLLSVYIAVSIMAFFYAYARTSTQLNMDNMNRSYQNLANTDVLTRLANRRRMTEVLYQEVSRSQRNQTTFSIINFDIDHFKEINDQHGHDAGDTILRNVPNIISNVLRTQDICARWGGEEFLVLLPGTPLNGAVNVAERIRKAFEQYRTQYAEAILSVTVSLGVFEFGAAENLEDCLKQADKNLYKAKSEGRNRVVAGRA